MTATKEYVTKDLSGIDRADIEDALNSMWDDGYALAVVTQHQVWGSDRMRSIDVFKRRTGRPPNRVRAVGL